MSRKAIEKKKISWEMKSLMPVCFSVPKKNDKITSKDPKVSFAAILNSFDRSINMGTYLKFVFQNISSAVYFSKY
jgi:hypothetical protein